MPCLRPHVQDCTNRNSRQAHGVADQRRGGGELAHQPNRPLHPLDGRREAPDRKRMAIRSADGAARSVRALVPVQPPKAVGCNRLLYAKFLRLGPLVISEAMAQEPSQPYHRPVARIRHQPIGFRSRSR